MFIDSFYKGKSNKKSTGKKESSNKNKLGAKNSLVNNINTKKDKGTAKSKKFNGIIRG